jgi:xanthosine utilization system XapX-like protein
MLRLNRILRGSLVDNAILGFSAVAGLSMGTIFGRLTRGVKSIGPVPAIALLGLLGIIPGVNAGLDPKNFADEQRLAWH